jgi:ABC-type antimicrobial peptide transport system permease subunit
VASPRFLATLLGGFALTAAVLALVGAYGVVAYAVRQREREIAVRMAIGAGRAQITRLFVRQGAVVLGAGLALGVIGALAAGRLLESQLFGVTASDPMALAAVAGAFGLAGLAAIWWPARRAAATDPALALRAE